MAADIRVCELEEEISRSVGLDVAEKLQQELNILQEEKQAADVRVWELEEKLSILNEDYLKKIDEFKLKMSTNQEKSTTNENDVIVKLQQQLNLLQEEKQAGDIRVCELEEEISRSVERDVVEKLQQQLIVLQEEKLAADIRVCELEEEISRSIGSDVTIKLQQQLIVLQEEKLAADIRVCELEEEISRSVGRDVVEKLQQQLIVLEEEKLAADIRVYEVEEEISNLNEDYQKKIDKIVTQKASDKEASLNSVNIAVLENDKLRMELSNVIEAQQKLLEIEANKYTQLVTETNEERLKSTVEMDEIVEKLNSTKCSLDDAKKAAMERDVAIQTLKSENTRLLLQNELNLNELNDKLKSLEAEIVENTTKLREIERKSSKLEDEVKNRDSMLMLKEDNIYSLKDELNNLKITMQERIDECAELKTRYRRRSCDGEKKVLILEAKNTELLQENGAIQARKLAVENELKKLKIECQHMLEQQIPQLVQDNQRMTSVINDHDFNYSLLDEKNCQLMKDNEKLTSLRDAEAMMKESLIKETESLQMELNCLNIKINEQLHSVNLVENAHLVKLQQMQNEIERLQSTENVAKASSNGSSRNGRSSLDDDLFLKQQILFEDRRNTPKRASIAKVERKNRRQSVHDDNRQLSVWEMFNDGECQTDPVDENCACAAMNEKIVKLSRDLRIKECQVQNYEKMSKINPLQLDVQELKKTLSREQKTHDDTRRELNETKRSIHKLQVQISDLERNQIVAVHKIEKSTQTLEEKNVEVSVKVSKLLELVIIDVFFKLYICCYF